MKKLIALLLAAAMMSMVMTACTEEANVEGESDAPEAIEGYEPPVIDDQSAFQIEENSDIVVDEVQPEVLLDENGNPIEGAVEAVTDENGLPVDPNAPVEETAAEADAPAEGEPEVAVDALAEANGETAAEEAPAEAVEEPVA